MTLLESVPEIVAGVAVEFVVFSIAAAVVYRLFSGRFLLPKREIILPNQRGVVVQDDRVIRVAGPGPCWLRPKQRVVLIDARPKPLQMAGLEVLSSDNVWVRISLSAEYKVVDAAEYYRSSSSAADALFVQLRRVINVAVRQQPGSTIAAAPDTFSARVLREMGEPAKHLGLAVVELDVYEVLPFGTLRVSADSSFEFPDTGLVH